MCIKRSFKHVDKKEVNDAQRKKMKSNKYRHFVKKHKKKLIWLYLEDHYVEFLFQFKNITKIFKFQRMNTLLLESFLLFVKISFTFSDF